MDAVLTASVAVPVFVIATAFSELAMSSGWLPKVKLTGITLMPRATPTPLRVILIESLLVPVEITTEATFEPTDVGLNVTLIVQLPSGRTVAQLLVCPN